VNVPVHQILEAARVQADMTFDDLWVAYFALGGLSSPETVRSYLGGSGVPLVDHDVLTHAINEKFVSLGGNHPVPYADDLT